MALFGGRINVVLFARQLGELHRLVSLLVFLTRKHLTKSEQWARRTAAHCAFTSYQLPYKNPQGKLKDRALAHLLAFSLFFCSLFKDGEGS